MTLKIANNPADKAPYLAETVSNRYIGPAQCCFTDLPILKAKFSVIFGTVSFPIDDNHTV